MRVSEEDIIKVLALFDKEDISYINFKYLIENEILIINNNEKIYPSNKKIMKLGGKYDRLKK